jgi:hypothetical protein
MSSGLTSYSVEKVRAISKERDDVFSNVKDRGNTFRNFGKLLSDYTASRNQKNVFVFLEYLNFLHGALTVFKKGIIIKM